MPDPEDFSSHESFMEACVPEVVGEGKSHDQAVGQCEGMWEGRAVSAHPERVERMANIRADEIKRGHISGILATDGEASDGHVLDIGGLRAQTDAPLLFGHDAHSQRGVIGSWRSFEKLHEKGTNRRALRGQAEIELGGHGALADARQDLAHMIESGHIRQLSIRWEPTEEPIRRTQLASDHWARVDEKELGANDPRRWGFYFPRSVMVEGSVVPLGADPQAIIGRIQETRNQDVRQFWLKGLENMLLSGQVPEQLRDVLADLERVVLRLRAEGVGDLGTLLRVIGHVDTNPANFEMVTYGEDRERILLPREAYDTIMRQANEKLEIAFDILHEHTTRSVDGGYHRVESIDAYDPHTMVKARAVSEVPASPAEPSKPNDHGEPDEANELRVKNRDKFHGKLDKLVLDTIRGRRNG